MTPKDAPTWSDAWNAQMTKKYKMRRDPKTGKRISKWKYVWNNGGRIASNMARDVCMLGYAA